MTYETRLAAARARAFSACASGQDRKPLPAVPEAALCPPTPAPERAARRRRRRTSSRRRLIATEQAIQLDELIKWVRKRWPSVDNSGQAAAANRREN